MLAPIRRCRAIASRAAGIRPHASARCAPARYPRKVAVLCRLWTRKGCPFGTCGMGDILIREDGQDREVVAIKPASQPISVAVLADTAQGSRVTDAYGTPEEYTRDIRVAVAAFARQLLSKSPEASVMLMEFGQAAIPVVPFTSSFADFDKGVNRLTAKPGVGFGAAGSPCRRKRRSRRNARARGAPSSHSTSSPVTNRAAKNPGRLPRRSASRAPSSGPYQCSVAA